MFNKNKKLLHDDPHVSFSHQDVILSYKYRNSIDIRPF